MNRKEYLLNKFAQECNEAAHRASKALEFTLDEIEPGQPLTNAERVMHEWVDAIAVMQLLIEEGVLPGMGEDQMQALIAAKKRKVGKFADYSRQLGALVE